MIFLPDSKSGKKPLYLAAPALDILAKLPRYEESAFVINGEVMGKPLADLKRPWAAILQEAKIENLRLHDLRHTFASVGAMGGLSLPIIGKLLGHLRSETTLRYSHLADDPVRQANELVGSRLKTAFDSHSLPHSKEPQALVQS